MVASNNNNQVDATQQPPISDESQVNPNSQVDGGDLQVVIPPERVQQLARRNEALRKEKEAPFSIFHAHFSDKQSYPFEMLKLFATSERSVVAKWSEEVRKEKHESLLKAIPEMSLVFGNGKWPEPIGFSPDQARDTYLAFLDYFLDNYVGLPSGQMLNSAVLQNCESKHAVGQQEAPENRQPVEGKGETSATAVEVPTSAGGNSSKKKSRKKHKHKRVRESSSSSEVEASLSSISPSSSPSSSESSSSSSSSSDSESSSDEGSAKRKRRRRKRKSRKRKRSRSGRRKGKKSSSKKKKKHGKRSRKKVSFDERIKAVQSSQRVGEKKYSQEHLFACQEVVKSYKTWSNPRKREDQKATVPMRVREFIQRHLADPDANILKVYDLAHVKKDQNERKHVTFLLNKMGKLASKVATARLERAQKALDKHNRLVDGAKMSKKARAESIKRECEWAGKIRWFSEIIQEGEKSYYLAKSRLEQRKRVDNFRCAHPDVSESVAKKIIKDFGEQPARGSSAGVGRSGIRVSSQVQSDQTKMINSLKSQLGQLMKHKRNNAPPDGGSAGARNGGPKKFACWHCGSKNHPVANCPVAAAGKPPVKGSFFYKKRNAADKNTGDGKK